MRRALSLSLLAVVACGNGAGAPPKTSGGDPAKRAEHESIGEAAAAQGGLSMFGGAGNREESTGTEIAFAGPLRAETISKKSPPKLDGVVKEWHERAPARETLSGTTDGLSLDVAVQASDEVFWLAAEVSDPKIVRTGKFGDKEDHVTLTIAFPSGSGRGALKAYEIGFWPGVPGSFAGAVKWTAGPNAGKSVAGAKIVESDTDKGKGVTIEAMFPWASFPDAVRVGMRASFKYHDGDGANVNGVLGTSAGTVDKPNELLALPIAAEQAVVENLLEQKGLSGTKPKIDVYTDLAGDDRKERVSVFGHFFTICGPGYRKGKQFFWREVAGEIVSLETSSVTGRGKEDLVVRRRATQGTSPHDILEVWTFPAGGEEPTTIFAAQIAVASADGKKRISNATRISAKEIEVTTEPAVGWDASSWNEPLADNMEPILLPWGPTKSKTYKLEGGKFVKTSEVAQAATGGAAPATAPNTAGASERIARDVPGPAAATAHPDLGRAVLEAYLKDAGLGATTKPRYDLAVNVDGDAQSERVALFGRDIVVLGPGFKNGAGYARLSLTQFADEKDISELTARDLTGDGGAELVVRGVRHVKAPTGESIAIDGLFVYHVKAGNIGRALAIETGREMSGKRAQGLVQFVPGKSKTFDVEARPGAVKGWTQQTYPWAPEKPGSGTIEPLLLPWGTVAHVRYVWNGTQFAPQP